MSHRAYLLLNITDGKTDNVSRLIWGRPGVVRVDLLDGHPDIIVTLEASDRQGLARVTNAVLAVLEQVTEDVSLLPVRTLPDEAGRRTLVRTGMM
ncbi:MAG: hypothetical protein HY529_02385 [Chloroflexi bacterium]|nr:hypothetical protein [Chloroflexota bacterium]